MTYPASFAGLVRWLVVPSVYYAIAAVNLLRDAASLNSGLLHFTIGPTKTKALVTLVAFIPHSLTTLRALSHIEKIIFEKAQ